MGIADCTVLTGSSSERYGKVPGSEAASVGKADEPTAGLSAVQHRCLSNTIWVLPGMLWECGMACAATSSLVFAFSALFVKLTQGRIPVLQVCVIRSSFCFMLTVVMMAATKTTPIFGAQKHRPILFWRGCCGAMAMISYYVALFLLPLGDAVVIGMIGPPITAVTARICLKEPLGSRGLVGCLVAMIGVVVVAHPPCLFGGHEHWSHQRLLGACAAVLSASLSAASVMIIRSIGTSEPAAVVTIWFHLGTMLMSGIPLLLGSPAKPVSVSQHDAWLMLGVALTSFTAQLLSSRSLQLVAAARAAAMGFTQVLYGYINGAVFFDEHLSAVGMVGVVLILTGVLLVTVKPAAQQGSAANKSAACTASAAVAHCTGPVTQLNLPGEELHGTKDDAARETSMLMSHRSSTGKSSGSDVDAVNCHHEAQQAAAAAAGAQVMDKEPQALCLSNSSTSGATFVADVATIRASQAHGLADTQPVCLAEVVRSSPRVHDCDSMDEGPGISCDQPPAPHQQLHDARAANLQQ